VSVLATSLAACSSGRSSGPAETARSYVQAVIERDGTTLCPLLDVRMRKTIDELVANVQRDKTWRGPADCPHVVKFMIGYPHENMAYIFTTGELVSVGRSRTATVGGHRYEGVNVKVRLTTERNGSYAPLGTTAPSPTLTDTVWLTQFSHGWRTAKPSLTLLAAFNGDILSEARLRQSEARQAVRPPTG
jgi:hypothetical protein